MALFALQYFDYLHASQKLSNRQSVQVWASTEDFRIFSNGFELRQTDRLWCKVIICVSFSSFAWGLLEKWRYRKVFWKCYVSPILKYMIHNQKHLIHRTFWQWYLLGTNANPVAKIARPWRSSFKLSTEFLYNLSYDPSTTQNDSRDSSNLARGMCQKWFLFGIGT